MTTPRPSVPHGWHGYASNVPAAFSKRAGAVTAAVVLTSLLGAALRAYRLGANDLWLDEANTVLVAQQALPAMLERLRLDDVHPPLFYLLVKLPLALGSSELALRCLPWLVGALTV